jgi:hypothetical protein
MAGPLLAIRGPGFFRDRPMLYTEVARVPSTVYAFKCEGVGKKLGLRQYLESFASFVL